MANHMVFKVNHMVQGQPWTIPTPEYTHMDFKVTIIYGQPYGFQGQPYGSRSTMDHTYAILLAYDFQGQFMWPTIWFSRSNIWFKVKPGLYLRHTTCIWFSRSIYVANHMVFKVNHMVQGQTWTIPTPYFCCNINL